LSELYSGERKINWLDRSFAKNPATPSDILEKVALSHDIYVLQGLLQNTKLSCSLLPTIDSSLAASDSPEDKYSRSTLEYLKTGTCLGHL
jgi:hypothetical protein